MKPSELLSKPGAWTQGSYARDKEGKSVHATSTAAVCWCLDGALDKCFAECQTSTLDIVVRLNKACKEKYHKGYITFNDTPGRTQQEVVDLLKSIGL